MLPTQDEKHFNFHNRKRLQGQIPKNKFIHNCRLKWHLQLIFIRLKPF